MKSFLTITALIEATTGLALAIIPSLLISILLGTSIKDSGAILISRLAGAALLTISIACWLLRNDTQSSVMAKAMIAYNLFSIALLVYWVFVEKISGPGLWPAVIIHVLLLVWCLIIERRVAVGHLTLGK